MIKNYSYETYKELEKILDRELVCDVHSDLHKCLLEREHEFIGSYEFRKTGFLERKVERKLYQDLDTGSLVIVDTGEDYEKVGEGRYSPYYFICIYVVDEDLGKYEYDLYYTYD